MKKAWLGILIVGLLALSSLAFAHGDECKKSKAECDGHHAKVSEVIEISLADLKTALKNKSITLLDANGEKTRKKHGSIAGAKQLSSYRTYDVAKELPEDKASALVFYCANERCTASDKAAQRAIDAGYSNVRVFRAGIMGWNKAKK